MFDKNFDSTKPTYFHAVRNLVGGDLVTYGPEFEEIEYRDNQTPPTKEEADAELERMMQAWGNKEYSREREKRYKEDKIKINDLIIALWEKVVEGRDDSANELQEKRLKIKNELPKA